MIHAETNIINDNNYSNIDIVKLYTINDDLELNVKYFNYDFENSLTVLSNSEILKDKPKFIDVEVENTKKLLESNQPIIVLNYFFMKNTLGKYGISIDNCQLIDLSNIFKKLELFGSDFNYSLDNIIEHSNIKSKLDRQNRGQQMLELFELLTNKLNLNINQLLSINNIYNSKTFDSLNSKYSGQNLNNISTTVLFSLLTFDSLNLKTKDCSIQEIKYNLIKYLLEDNENVKEFNIKDINNYKEFTGTIINIFENERIYNIDSDKLKDVYNMCIMYYKVKHNEVDFKEIKNTFNNLQSNDLNIEEIQF